MAEFKLVTVNGVRLVRSEQRGPLGGRKYTYQAESSSRDWGYWYDSARQAARESNESDRMVVL